MRKTFPVNSKTPNGDYAAAKVSSVQLALPKPETFKLKMVELTYFGQNALYDKNLEMYYKFDVLAETEFQNALELEADHRQEN